MQVHNKMATISHKEQMPQDFSSHVPHKLLIPPVKKKKSQTKMPLCFLKKRDPRQKVHLYIERIPWQRRKLFWFSTDTQCSLFGATHFPHGKGKKWSYFPWYRGFPFPTERGRNLGFRISTGRVDSSCRTNKSFHWDLGGEKETISQFKIWTVRRFSRPSFLPIQTPREKIIKSFYW